MKFDLVPVPKAKNLHLIAWTDGYVMVQFRGRPDRYIFGPDIDGGELEKILKNPYPDALFQKTIRSKYKCHKIGKA